MIPRLIEPKVVKHLYAVSTKEHIPISGTFELTPMCNMKCEMCYVRMSKEEINESGGRFRKKAEWIKLAQDAKEQGMLFLLLTGGEPFLYPEFKELYQELSSMGFVISINTNATLIDETVVEYLKENPPFRINITLYGSSDETYEKLCHNPRGYTQVTKAIHLLKEAGIMVKLNSSITPYNIHDLSEIVQYAKSQNLMLQASAYMFPPLRKNEQMIGKNQRFTPEEAAKAAVEIVRLQNGEDDFKSYINHLDVGLESMGTEECINATGDPILCSAGRCAFWITWDGKMLPCGMMTAPVIETFQDDFKCAWEKMGQIIEDIYLPEKCSVCKDKELCHSCAAVVLTETGTFDMVPQYRCQMTKAYNKECRKMKQQLEKECTDEKE